MKNLLKNSKGSMAVYVTVTILCFMIILVGIFSITASIRKNQLRTLPKIKEAYEQDLDNIDEIYEEQESIRSLSGGEFNELKGVNTPDLADGALTPIVWDSAANSGTGGWRQTTGDDENWYNYTVADKKWANAVIGGTFNDRILDESETGYSMWVWIPRFAYQISSNYHNGGEGVSGTINIKFIKGTTNEAADGTTTWDNTSGEGNWNIHPAFQYNGTKAGMWVAKFEASSTTGNTDTEEGDNVTTKTLQIKPGVASWRYIDIGNAFTVCQNYNTSLNSHLMKNSEWGAVAYLAQSSYGKNSEVWINPNSNHVTGQAGTTANTSGTTTTYSYNDTTYGVNASTTGTVYGIYDMNGGSWEYVAAYLNNGKSSLMTYGSSLMSSNIPSYMKDIYKVGSIDTRKENYLANATIYGDAVYEISSGTYDEEGTFNRLSWYGDYSLYRCDEGPFFLRGGFFNNTLGAGTFAFSGDKGNTSIDYTFRPVLIAP